MASSAENKFPIPKFHFLVDIGDTEIAFQEVTGLVQENEITEYRNGSDPEFIPARRASMRKSGTVSFKKGLFTDDYDLIMLYDNILSKDKFFSTDSEVMDISVYLKDETNSIAFIWVIKNAVPIKLDMESLNATENAIAIEQIDFSHSGIEVL